METTRLIEDLARRMADSVPAGVQAVGDDLEKNFRGLLQAGLDKLDLVTREEFEVQTKVLERTRAKLNELEAKLAALESVATDESPVPEDTDNPEDDPEDDSEV